MNGLYPPLGGGASERQSFRLGIHRLNHHQGYRRLAYSHRQKSTKLTRRTAARCAILNGAKHTLASAAQQAVQAVSGALIVCFRILTQPPGVGPNSAVNWLPGWEQAMERGPRRWFGLVPGRQQTVRLPGAWYTPSGLAHALSRIPTGVWLLLLIYLGIKLAGLAKQRRKERDIYIQERTLIAAAKSSDLKLQKNRMLRALGGEPEEKLEDFIEVDAAEVQWQDPTEWQPVTWKQWEDFMDKSRALQMREDKWWDVEMMESHVPYHKTAYDRLESSGQLPDYNH